VAVSQVKSTRFVKDNPPHKSLCYIRSIKITNTLDNTEILVRAHAFLLATGNPVGNSIRCRKEASVEIVEPHARAISHIMIFFFFCVMAFKTSPPSIYSSIYICLPLLSFVVLQSLLLLHL